ncbi:MAG: hypothetical protein IKP52_06675 [Prevotella sp.]|nr:hypothetical protein [Prevotella sp.]
MKKKPYIAPFIDTFFLRFEHPMMNGTGLTADKIVVTGLDDGTSTDPTDPTQPPQENEDMYDDTDDPQSIWGNAW